MLALGCRVLEEIGFILAKILWMRRRGSWLSLEVRHLKKLRGLEGGCFVGMGRRLVAWV